MTNNPAGDGQLPNKSETGQMAFSKTLWLISSKCMKSSKATDTQVNLEKI